MPTKILITGALHPQAIERFQSHKDFDVTYQPDCPRDDLLKIIGDYHVLVSRSETTVDRMVMDAGTNLKVVARAAVGVGNIDTVYATEKGILVINCPGKNTNSAAELTWGLMLSMFRNVPQAHQVMKSGGWDRHKFAGNELKEKKLGIVGLGNVGHRVAKFAHGFDMEVYAYDPYIASTMFQNYKAFQCKSLQELAEKVDILSVHVPLNKETQGMVNGGILDAMHPGSYAVNAARGGVIHEQDLLARLNSGHIAGAAIDTWENEPKPDKHLIDHPKVWCTPHIGATTEEAQKAIGNTVYEQVEKAVDGGVVDYPVNLPQLGVIDNPLLKAYAVLAEKLGSLVGQILTFNPHKIEVSYRGNLAGLDQSLVRLGFMKGYAGHVVDDFVSYVNAEAQFEKLGLSISENDDAQFESYKSALKIWVKGDGAQVLTVGGVVFDDKYLRISLVDDFYFEVEPNGYMVLVKNNDVPGVIGDVGHFLASNNINIDTFALSRNRKGGQAMALLKVDTPLTTEQQKKMTGIKNLLQVGTASL
jgi:D-3-phosphoglycerate dehydrogenase